MTAISTALVMRSDDPSGPLRWDQSLLMDGRAELKYCAPVLISQRVLEVARAHLAPDVLAVGPRQRVTSLYLDNSQLTFLRWHRERAVDRFKLRIRRYGEHPSSTLYAELKRKTGSVVRKRRAAFPAQALHAVLNGSGAPDGASSPQDMDNLREFARRRCQCGASPRMLITCVRESLRDPDDGTAVTVDRALEYQPTRRADLAGHPNGWRPMPLSSASGPATTLVELKYGAQLPAWMDALIAQLAPWRVSFSKYATAMNAACLVSPRSSLIWE
jgi:hypothetical protein